MVRLRAFSPLSVLAPAADDADGPAPGAAASVPALLLPAKRREEVDLNAHLLPPSKRRKESEEKQNRGRWSEFDVDEKKEEHKGEEKKAEIAPETVESELTRWFAQNPPDEWYITALIFLCYDVSSFRLVWVSVLQGEY